MNMNDQDMKDKKDLLDALDDPGSLSKEELDAILNDPRELEDARLLGITGRHLYIVTHP